MLFKTFTKLIQVTLNVIGLMVWWKMHYSTIYCTQLINFILILVFNWFFSNAQFLFSTSIYVWVKEYYASNRCLLFNVVYSIIYFQDKYINSLFIHVPLYLIYMYIFKDFECLNGNENYLYRLVVHLDKGHFK